MLVLSSFRSILLPILVIPILATSIVGSIIYTPTNKNIVPSHWFSDRSLSIPYPGNPSDSGSLHKRVRQSYNLGQDWFQIFDAFEPILPNQLAAAFFERFYGYIVENLSPGGSWAAYPTWPSFIIGYGNFQINFHSTLGPIPWPVIVAFARIMLENSRRGFAGRYNFVYYHRGTGNAITIWFSTRSPRLHNALTT